MNHWLGMAVGLTLCCSTADAERLFSVNDNGLIDIQSVEDKAKLLQRLGYDGMCTRPRENTEELLAVFDQHDLKVVSTYVSMEAADADLPAHIIQHLELLKGRDTLVWLMLRNRDAKEEDAVSTIQKVCDLAAANHLEVALYPHHGCYTDTVEHCEQLRKQANRPNLGVSFSLCHFLAQNEDEKLASTLRSIAPNLKIVQISGANRLPHPRPDWNQLIQPLDAGDVDVGQVLQVLDDIGYDGPVSLQCYRVPPPAQKHLASSMKAWRKYNEQP